MEETTAPSVSPSRPGMQPPQCLHQNPPRFRTLLHTLQGGLRDQAGHCQAPRTAAHLQTHWAALSCGTPQVSFRLASPAQTGSSKCASRGPKPLPLPQPSRLVQSSKDSSCSNLNSRNSEGSTWPQTQAESDQETRQRGQNPQIKRRKQTEKRNNHQTGKDRQAHWDQHTCQEAPGRGDLRLRLCPVNRPSEGHSGASCGQSLSSQSSHLPVHSTLPEPSASPTAPEQTARSTAKTAPRRDRRGTDDVAREPLSRQGPAHLWMASPPCHL